MTILGLCIISINYNEDHFRFVYNFYKSKHDDKPLVVMLRPSPAAQAADGGGCCEVVPP